MAATSTAPRPATWLSPTPTRYDSLTDPLAAVLTPPGGLRRGGTEVFAPHASSGSGGGAAGLPTRVIALDEHEVGTGYFDEVLKVISNGVDTRVFLPGAGRCFERAGYRGVLGGTAVV